ncbi:hypothetical protein [Nonomuraea rosea]
MTVAAPGGLPGAAADGAVMVSRDDLVLNPVWWDPGRPGAVAIGALVATDRLLTYVTHEETVFTLARADISVRWHPLRAFVEIDGAGAGFRLRFLPPHTPIRPLGVLQARRKSRALRSWLAATGNVI